MSARPVPGQTLHPNLAYVIEPRFPGGTSSAVASELRVAAQVGQVVVHARTSAMFGAERRIAPVLERVIEELDVPVVWDATEIRAEVVILHNPAFLKFQPSLGARIIARQLIIVTHENFLRPGGNEGFDVAACLDCVDRATLALRKSVAPISEHNRSTVAAWFAQNRTPGRWHVLPVDWFNICAPAIPEPARTPRDRRGRLSRAGHEKFPPLSDLDLCFPPHAEVNVILGADSLLKSSIARPHWMMLPFGSTEVHNFFEMIDFFVYFTAPTWRESFGRVIAEALAAGKVVLTDPDTGSTFGDAVVACRPGDVDAVIEGFVADPGRFAERAQKAQRVLDRFSADAFRRRMSDLLAIEPRGAA